VRSKKWPGEGLRSGRRRGNPRSLTIALDGGNKEGGLPRPPVIPSMRLLLFYPHPADAPETGNGGAAKAQIKGKNTL